MSYNNYYNDRRIIAPGQLNGGWNNATGNNNINDPANYTNPAESPNACTDPMNMTRYTTGSYNAFYSSIIFTIEPGAIFCCKPNPIIDPATGYVFHTSPGSYPYQVRNGMIKILSDRNVNHSTDSFSINLAKVKAQINSQRPVILSMQESLGGSDHFVVTYGYGDYTYPVGHAHAGETYSGYITHFGWGSSLNNVWMNSAWCNAYITMQIEHMHNYIPTGDVLDGQKMILRCIYCKHRKTDTLFNVSGNTVTGLMFCPR